MNTLDVYVIEYSTYWSKGAMDYLYSNEQILVITEHAPDSAERAIATGKEILLARDGYQSVTFKNMTKMNDYKGVILPGHYKMFLT